MANFWLFKAKIGQIWPILPSNDVKLHVQMTVLTIFSRNSRNVGWCQKMVILGHFWHQPALRELRAVRKIEVFLPQFSSSNLVKFGQIWPRPVKLAFNLGA